MWPRTVLSAVKHLRLWCSMGTAAAAAAMLSIYVLLRRERGSQLFVLKPSKERIIFHTNVGTSAEVHVVSLKTRHTDSVNL